VWERGGISQRTIVFVISRFLGNVVHAARIRNPHEILFGKYKGRYGELDLIVQREVIGIFFFQLEFVGVKVAQYIN